MNEAAKQEIVEAQKWDDRPAPALVPLTPMDMLSRAVQSGSSMEIIERMAALAERWEAGQARRAFDEAMADAKAEIPTIIKNRKVSYGEGTKKTEYKHEDLAEIARTVDPILSKHGLSYRFRTASPIGQPISVTCVVSHRLGHFEENTLVAGRDESGSKNAIQSIGSALTYLCRYTLKAALGLAAANEDDGRAADSAPALIESEQFSALVAKIKEVGADEAKFLAAYKIDALADLPAKMFEPAMALLNRKAKKQ